MEQSAPDQPSVQAHTACVASTCEGEHRIYRRVCVFRITAIACVLGMYACACLHALCRHVFCTQARLNAPADTPRVCRNLAHHTACIACPLLTEPAS